MNSSRTSTKKKVINNKKKSTSSTSTVKKKVVTSKKTTNKNQKSIQKNKSNIRNKTQNNTKKSINVNRNTHSAKNNIRLNRQVEDDEYVPFFDDNENAQEITPNNLRKVEPQKVQKNVPKEKTKIKVNPIAVIKLVFFVGIITVLGYLMFTLETFNLTEIKVKGNEKYTENEIISKANLTIGENVFKQLFLKGKNSIDLSYISKASFGYSFPSTIVISVKERYPAYIAIDKNTGNYYKIDNDGYILEQCDLSDKKDEVIVEGLVFEENVKFGTQIDEVYIKKIDIYNNIKKLLEEYEIKGTITRVNFSNSLTIITLDDKLKLKFANDSNLEYKVSFLKGIIQKNGDIEEGTIDMSIENPVYSKYD